MNIIFLIFQYFVVIFYVQIAMTWTLSDTVTANIEKVKTKCHQNLI